MALKHLKSLRRLLKKSVTLLVIPHFSSLKTRKYKFTLSFIFAMAGLWTLVTLWAGFIVGKYVDYHVVYADNAILKRKVAFTAKLINDSKKKLDMTWEADRKLRQMLKMGKKENITKSGIGGHTYDERLTFKKVLAQKASQISDFVFKRNVQYLSQESERALSSFQDITWYVTNQQNIYRATPSIWPTSGRFSSHYGYRIITINGRRTGGFHHGVDIANKVNTPIYVTADGTVRIIGWAGSLGQTILIDHGFGYSTLYGHVTEIKVKPGQSVKRGDMIARMGTTGRSTGTHLHYEVWRYEKDVNPMAYLKVGSLKRKDEDLQLKLAELF